VRDKKQVIFGENNRKKNAAKAKEAKKSETLHGII
jgi:hypothetical protein